MFGKVWLAFNSTLVMFALCCLKTLRSNFVSLKLKIKRTEFVGLIDPQCFKCPSQKLGGIEL